MVSLCLFLLTYWLFVGLVGRDLKFGRQVREGFRIFFCAERSEW